MKNKILGITELEPGMTVLPYKGSTYQKKDDELDWSWATNSAWWQHIITSVSEDTVTFARPYANHSAFSKQPWLTAEVYDVFKTSSQRYLLLEK